MLFEIYIFCISLLLKATLQEMKSTYDSVNKSDKNVEYVDFEIMNKLKYTFLPFKKYTVDINMYVVSYYAMCNSKVHT